MLQKPNPERIFIHTGAAPFSTDPIAFDYLMHHVMHRPLLATLITEHRIDGPQGLIAEAWKSEDDFKKWTFTVRTGMRFASGLKIDSAAIAMSLNRMAWLLKKRRSHEGFLEFLDGLNELESIQELATGITYSDSQVTLKFKKSIPNALHYLSFGQYSIVSPNDYDSMTGDWKDPKKVDSSGAYTISDWAEDRIDIRFREDFPRPLVHPNVFPALTFVWTAKYKDQIHIRVGHDDYQMGTAYRFLGHVKSDIRYILVYGYQNDSNPFKDKAVRKPFRDRLLSKLKAEGFPIIKSFIPLGVDGIKEFPLAEPQTFPKLSGKIKILKYDAFLPLWQRLPNLIAETAKEFGLDYEFVSPPLKEIQMSRNDPSLVPPINLGMNGTGIVIDRPRDDLKFMVKSKEGIRLPDPTTRLSQLLEDESFDVQKYNEILDDDALVWPLMHVAGGIWVRKDIVDVSLLNPEPPPTDLTLLGNFQ